MRRTNALALPRRKCEEAAPETELVQDRIWVEQLRLSDFRSYAALHLSLGEEPVVLVGENGAGKTNLLEAISLLGPGHGLRGRSYAELARMGGENGWAVAATVWSRQGLVEIGTGFGLHTGHEGTGRSVRIAGKETKPGALAEFVSVVWVTPAMDGLFTGPPSERRRFLDQLVLAVDPKLRTPYGRFERAMRQRNRLFEMGETSPALFDGIEEQMAEAAIAISAARLDTVSRLSALAAEPASSDFPWATLSLAGMIEEALVESPAVEVEDGYCRLLRDGRERDAAARRTLEGPHRSDLNVGHGPKSLPAKDCSSGEQKALLLGLVLAEARLLKGLQDGKSPLLLLDEVAAHLDERRREALFAEIFSLKAQAWMTGTEQKLFAPLSASARFFAVAGGLAPLD